MTATPDPRFLGIDDPGHEALRAVCLGRLLDILGTLFEPAAPLRLLDAGCGTGWVTRALASSGHQVDGIDAAEAAVVECRSQARRDGRDRYQLSRLDTWAPAYLYDVVVSVDGMSRIREDSVWAASVVNLASLVRVGGRLVLAEHDLAEDHLWGEDRISRARQRYVELLAPEGLEHRRFVPYDLGDNNAGFHVFDRIA